MRRHLKRLRYLLSFVVPVPMSTTVGRKFEQADIQAGGVGNHFTDETHHDLVSIKWVQWRHRIFRQRTVSICLT